MGMFHAQAERGLNGSLHLPEYCHDLFRAKRLAAPPHASDLVFVAGSADIRSRRVPTAERGRAAFSLRFFSRPSRLEDRLEQRGEAKARLGELDARLRFRPVLTPDLAWSPRCTRR